VNVSGDSRYRRCIDAKDLIYEGIATIYAFCFLKNRKIDAKDLIYEGIANHCVNQRKACQATVAPGSDL